MIPMMKLAISGIRVNDAKVPTSTLTVMKETINSPGVIPYTHVNARQIHHWLEEANRRDNPNRIDERCEAILVKFEHPVDTVTQAAIVADLFPRANALAIYDDSWKGFVIVHGNVRGLTQGKVILATDIIET
jgi:hypothetical protein